MGKTAKRLSRATLLLAVILIPADGRSASAFELSIDQTFTLAPNARVIAVQDLDGDGLLDVVVREGSLGSERTLSIVEIVGGLLVPRLTLNDSRQFRGPVVGDVDGDSTPEIAVGRRSDHSVRIWEAAGNDSYVLRHVEAIGSFTEILRIGDSDGNGRREVLIPRESFPSRVYLLEAVADNVYVNQGALTGGGGNTSVAGVGDLDGDGAPDLIFSDDSYGNVEKIYRFEGRSLVFQDADAKVEATRLGDTDGNGLGEVIGFDSITRFGPPELRRLRIYESSPGASNALLSVLDTLADGFSPEALDVDGDRQDELWRRLDGGSGALNVLGFAQRMGGSLVEVYQSGPLFLSHPSDLLVVLALGDTDGDGRRELAVQQGALLHLLTVEGLAPINEIPALSPLAAVILVGLLAGAALGILRS